MTASVAARIAQLADVDEIIRLKHRYWVCNDAGFLSDEVASLFTVDGVWASNAFGEHVGREAIRTFFKGLPAAIPFCAHVGMNPIVDVEGDRATARWRALLLYTQLAPAGPAAHIALLDYVDEFARADGKWHIRKLDILFNFNVPFGASWTDTAITR